MNSFRDSRFVQILSVAAIVAAFTYSFSGQDIAKLVGDYFSKIKMETIFPSEKVIKYDLDYVDPTIGTPTTTQDDSTSSSTESYSESYSESVVVTQTQPTKKQFYYPTPTSYVYPTYSYPTKTAEQIKWEEDFQKEWNERQIYIDQKNKEVRDAQKKFCEENPDLCNR